MDYSKWRGSDATPPMTVVDALGIASRRSGRPIAQVRSATYVSAMELQACLLENPNAGRKMHRFEPHWRIHFAGEEAIFDDGHGPGYTFVLGDADDVFVFLDGSALTLSEVDRGD